MDTMVHIGADPKAIVVAAREIKGLVELFPAENRTGEMGAEMFRGFYRAFNSNGASMTNCTLYGYPPKRKAAKKPAKPKRASKRK